MQSQCYKVHTYFSNIYQFNLHKLVGDQLCTVLNIVMVLLEDEDLDVRNAMSNYEDSLRVRIKINNTTHTM